TAFTFTATLVVLVNVTDTSIDFAPTAVSANFTDGGIAVIGPAAARAPASSTRPITKWRVAFERMAASRQPNPHGAGGTRSIYHAPSRRGPAGPAIRLLDRDELPRFLDE